MNNIDDLFKEELGGYTEAPPPMVWDALEKRLQADNKRRVYPYRWFWYIGIVSFIVLLGSSIAWMMAANANKPAGIAIGTGTELPQNTAVAAVNSKPGNTSHTTNSAKKATHTKQVHHKAQANNNTTKNNDHKEGVAVANRTQTRKHHENHSTAPGNKKAASDDLYADTDDDQYIVGGTNSPHKNQETPGQDGSGVAYSTQARSQHNIRVAETDPVQTVHENNYGSYAAVTASKAKEIDGAHYDIDGDRDNTPDIYKANAAHRTQSRKNRTANTGIARNTNAHTSALNEAIASSKSNAMTSRKTAKKPATPVMAAIPAEIAAVNSPVRKHTDVTASEPKKVVAAAKPQPNTVPVPDKKMASGNAVTANNTPVKKMGLAQDAATAPVESAMQVATHKAATHKASHRLAGNKVKEEVRVNSIPVAAAATVPAGKAKANHNDTKQSTGSYAASSKSEIKMPAKQAAKTGAAKVAAKKNEAATGNKLAKNNKALAPGNTVVAGNNKAGKPQPIAKEEKATGNIATATKPSASVKQPQKQSKPAYEARKENKTAAVSEQPSVKDDNKPVKKETVEKPKQDNATAAIDKPSVKNDTKLAKKETTRKTNTRKSAAPVPAVPPVNTYSSSLSKRTLEQENIVIDNLKVNNFEAQQPLADAYYELLPSTFKNDADTEKEKNATPEATRNATTDSTAKHSLFARKFEAGLKGGVETGFNARAANKLVVSPYLQYNLNDKFSLLTQPSVKVSHVNGEQVGDTKSYNDNSKGRLTETDSGAVYFVVPVGASSVVIRDTLRKYNYAYDSIVKSYSTGGTYVEVELPLLLQYKIGKGLSVYGGVNSVFSKYTSIKENTGNYTGIFHTITILPAGSAATQPNPANLHLPGTPISQYAGPSYPAQKGDLFRMGYMLGFSYEYKKRWLFDALVQQAMVKPNYEAGVNTNAPLAMPYFRLTLGYKLTK